MRPATAETPLITAASYGDADVARILIEAGADLEATAAPTAGGVPGGTRRQPKSRPDPSHPRARHNTVFDSLKSSLVVMIRLQACLDQARAATHSDGSAEADTTTCCVDCCISGSRQVCSTSSGSPESECGSPSPAAAATLARDHSRDDVGTEHLLDVLAIDPDSQASRVLHDLGIDPADIVHELERKGPLGQSRSRRRRRRHNTEPKCSFCRKAKPGVRKIAGPHVCICEDCLHLAHDALSARDSTPTR